MKIIIMANGQMASADPALSLKAYAVLEAFIK